MKGKHYLPLSRKEILSPRRTHYETGQKILIVLKGTMTDCALRYAGLQKGNVVYSTPIVIQNAVSV